MPGSWWWLSALPSYGLVYQWSDLVASPMRVWLLWWPPTESSMCVFSRLISIWHPQGVYVLDTRMLIIWSHFLCMSKPIREDVTSVTSSLIGWDLVETCIRNGSWTLLPIASMSQKDASLLFFNLIEWDINFMFLFSSRYPDVCECPECTLGH